MPVIVIAPPRAADPLRALMAGAFASDTRRPFPLLSTAFDVTIEGGFAVVETKRLLRNDEPESIEATITFPVPVHATLFSLEARVDGRTLKARAERRDQARVVYELAIDQGKGAVLHEEVLRGVHMLSVGHVRPGGEVEVRTAWATTLSMVDGKGCLRIPLTVGDIYGRSGLSSSDELIHGGPVQVATLTVRSVDGAIELNHGQLEDGRAEVALDTPIDLVVTGWTPRDLVGRAADGRDVVLRIEPQPAPDLPLDAALLIDRSGSMAQPVAGHENGITKHEAAVAGLQAVADRLGDGDFVDLWQFNTALTHVGSTKAGSRLPMIAALWGGGPRQRLLALADRLEDPEEGTEIGAALAGVVRQSSTRDVLLVTDGKSHALDVQAMAVAGRRVAVVLVGEDSLEGNVGHLAALTGGDIFIAAAADLSEVMAAALASLRRPCRMPEPVRGELREVRTTRANAAITAEWREPAEAIADTVLARAVAAVAAGLALPVLDAKAAAALAVTEGMVTHLTSLVLVDEAAEVQEGIPATRKIALPSPRAQSMDLGPSSHRRSESMFSRSGPKPVHVAEGPDSLPARPMPPGHPQEAVLKSGSPQPSLDLSIAGMRIDWTASPNDLIAGDLSGVDEAVVRLLESAARMPRVVELATRLGLSPVALVVGLLARARARHDRSAARIARAVFGDHSEHPEVNDLGIELLI